MLFLMNCNYINPGLLRFLPWCNLDSFSLLLPIVWSLKWPLWGLFSLKWWGGYWEYRKKLISGQSEVKGGTSPDCLRIQMTAGDLEQLAKQVVFQPTNRGKRDISVGLCGPWFAPFHLPVCARKAGGSLVMNVIMLSVFSGSGSVEFLNYLDFTVNVHIRLHWLYTASYMHWPCKYSCFS